MTVIAFILGFIAVVLMWITWHLIQIRSEIEDSSRRNFNTSALFRLESRVDSAEKEILQMDFNITKAEVDILKLIKKVRKIEATHLKEQQK